MRRGTLNDLLMLVYTNTKGHVQVGGYQQESASLGGCLQTRLGTFHSCLSVCLTSVCMLVNASIHVCRPYACRLSALKLKTTLAMHVSVPQLPLYSDWCFLDT